MTLNENGVTVQLAQARTIIALPSAFASAWSPGFDLHVTGEGETPDEARADLQRNLAELGHMLLRKAESV